MRKLILFQVHQVCAHSPLLLLIHDRSGLLQLELATAGLNVPVDPDIRFPGESGEYRRERNRLLEAVDEHARDQMRRLRVALATT